MEHQVQFQVQDILQEVGQDHQDLLDQLIPQQEVVVEEEQLLVQLIQVVVVELIAQVQDLLVDQV